MRQLAEVCQQNSRLAFLSSVLLIVVISTVATAECFHTGWKTPLTPKGNKLERIFTYLLLTFASAGAVAYDFQTLGPTMALRLSAVSAAAAWVFAVPLGLFGELLVKGMFYVILCFLSLFSAAAISQIDPPWKYAGFVFLAGSLFLATQGAVMSMLTHVFGAVVIFLGVYCLVRQLMSASWTVSPVSSWEGLEDLKKDSEEYKQIDTEFTLACGNFQHKYSFFWLEVHAVHKVQTGKKLQRTSAGQSLFHGTPRVNAQAILSDGFRLPSKAGMFGKGIYFADCPMKSWQYTDGLRSWRAGVILVCWVELGKAKHAKNARPGLTRPPKRSLWQWIKREGPYESVIGDDHTTGGTLRVPEYVVFDPTKVEVDYVLEVWEVPQRPT